MWGHCSMWASIFCPILPHLFKGPVWNPARKAKSPAWMSNGMIYMKSFSYCRAGVFSAICFVVCNRWKIDQLDSWPSLSKSYLKITDTYTVQDEATWQCLSIVCPECLLLLMYSFAQRLSNLTSTPTSSHEVSYQGCFWVGLLLVKREYSRLIDSRAESLTVVFTGKSCIPL